MQKIAPKFPIEASKCGVFSLTKWRSEWLENAFPWLWNDVTLMLYMEHEIFPWFVFVAYITPDLMSVIESFKNKFQF